MFFHKSQRKGLGKMEITRQTFGFCTAMHNALLPSCTEIVCKQNHKLLTGSNCMRQTCVLYIVLTPSVLILLTFCQAILVMLVWRISVLNQLHEYCTDIVRRNAVLVTQGSWGVNYSKQLSLSIRKYLCSNIHIQ